MASSTKKALAAALKKMMEVKPIDKVTIKDLVEQCGVNRQTFYYHFDDVYDLMEWIFEEDANAALPQKVIYENWSEDVVKWFKYLKDNSSFVLNVYNSNSRLYMLRYIRSRLEECVRSFTDIVSADRNLDKQDYEFIVSLYTECVVGAISRWLDYGMILPKEINPKKLLKAMENNIENLIDQFTK